MILSYFPEEEKNSNGRIMLASGKQVRHCQGFSNSKVIEVSM